MLSRARTAPSRTDGSLGSTSTTETTTGPATVSKRYVARTIPGAIGSRSLLDPVTIGKGAGGASEPGSGAADTSRTVAKPSETASA